MKKKLNCKEVPDKLYAVIQGELIECFHHSWERRLDRYYKEYENTLFVNDQLKKAIDDIYKYPLKEFARETLNHQLKVGISDDQLSALVVSLREEDELLNKEPQIICSLGLKTVNKFCCY